MTLRKVSYFGLSSFLPSRSLGGNLLEGSCSTWLGYPLSLKAFSVYVSSLEQALRSLVSSPLTRLAKVPLGGQSCILGIEIFFNIQYEGACMSLAFIDG